MFIIALRYVQPIEAIEKVLPDHIAYLEKHYESGDFLLSGRQVPRTGGVIIARAASRRQAETIAKEDPFYQAGVASFDLIEFVPSKCAAGLESLKEV